MRFIVIVHTDSSTLKNNSLHINYILSDKDSKKNSCYNCHAYAILNDINKSATLVRNIYNKK